MIERLAQGDPGLCGLVESLSTSAVEAVVLAMRPLVGRNDIRIERARLIKPPQCSVDRGIADVIQAAAWPDKGASIADWVEELKIVANDLEAPAMRV